LKLYWREESSRREKCNTLAQQLLEWLISTGFVNYTQERGRKGGRERGRKGGRGRDGC
jgi:hypothetical protein